MSVVNFPSPTPVIWVCECGCSTFELHETGEAVCANCQCTSSASGGAWFEDITKGPARDPDAPPPIADVQGNGSVEFARGRIQQLAAQSDAVVLVVVRECGAVHTWSATETDEQIQWAKRKIAEGEALIRGPRS